jgi:Cation/multidrug efflux pump
MRNIIRFAVKNPVTISMIVLAILLLGKISYDRLSVDLLPNMNSPRLFVEIQAGERPPEEIERMFVEDMESMAIRQNDVVQVSSNIKAGSARLTVEYSQNKNMDEAFLDLQKAMNTYSQNSNIQSLNITQHDPNTAPVVQIAMWHNSIKDMAELRKVADNFIRNELIRIEGVAEVALSGQEVPMLTIKTNPYRLSVFGLTMSDIESRITANNQSISGGRVNELGLQYLVKSTTLLNTEADFENLIVSYRATTAATGGVAAANAAGNSMAPVYLREVADVEFENARPTNIVRINGERCIGLSVFKEMQFNTVKAVELINAQLQTIENSLGGYNFQVVSDQGSFIKSAIDDVKNTAVLGLLLAIIVLFLFLRRLGTTIIISLSIPISIVATFNLMYFNDLTLNVMTLGGLALGGGMLIDNAIVVIESIFRNHEKGLSRDESIITGTTEVSGAVIASTLTTVVIFLPIVYLHGVAGEMFKDQAWTVAFSLISSLFVALFVIPMFYDKLSGRKKAKAESKSVQFKWYSGALASILKARWAVIIVSVILLGLSVLIIPFIGTEFLPRSESKEFSVLVKLPEGTRIEKTDATIQNLEFMLHSISGSDSLLTIYSHIGEGSPEKEVFEGEHTAMMKVILSKECTLMPEQIISSFIDMTKNINGLELAFKQDNYSFGALFGGDEAPLVVEIKGDDLNEIEKITDLVLLRMATIDGIYNVKSSMADGAPELSITVDRAMAGINNISVSTVTEQIRQQLVGRDIGKMDYKGEMRDIVIKLPEIAVSDMLDLPIRSGNQQYLLREIASISSSNAPKEIFRRNQGRINKVLADMNVGQSLDKVAESIRQSVSDIDLPVNYSINVTGEEEKRQESMNSLMFALILSVILVYMVLASQYESLLHPFTIMLTIPLSLVGAILLFFITGTTINIMGVIGIILLAGIAINNSILLVGRITQLKETMDLTEAIIQAGQQRIRPIIMTTITTILALLPMSLNIGEGAALRSSMAIAVIGGLVTSTLMSLVVIPCVYYVFEQTKNRLKRKG